MAKPRVFLSSTYYDMRTVHNDLERFIREQGYEPVLFERGHVPYGAEEKLEDDCYREITNCDILINILGGKFGTESKDTQHSVSQKELLAALKLGKQIYIFVEKRVLAEHETYRANKKVEGFTPIAVNDVRVYEFLEEIYALPGKNPISPFETSEEITRFLKEQWAGLFQMLLQEHARQKEVNVLEKMEASAATLNQLVKFLTEERTKGDQAIRDILLSNHPLFNAIRTTMAIPYRVFFETLSEMEKLLEARQTTLVEQAPWDDPIYREYLSNWPKAKKVLKIKADLFAEDGNLRIIRADEWDDKNVILEDVTQPLSPEEESTADDLPF